MIIYSPGKPRLQRAQTGHSAPGRAEWSVLFSVLLAVPLFLLLFLCGSRSVAAKERTRISLWLYPVGGLQKEENVAPIIEAFEKEYPDIAVDVEYLDYSTGDEQVQAALQAGTGPDVIFEGPERLVARWGEEGRMLDLSDLLGEKEREDITSAEGGQTILRTCRGTDGKYYEYPLVMTPHCMVINLDLFEKVGALQYIDTENHTWTTEGFIKSCQLLRDSGLVETPGVVYCGGQGGDQGTRALVSNLYGARFTNEKHTRYTINSAEGVRALKLLRQMVSDGSLTADPHTQAGDEITRFKEGKTALCFQWNSGNETDAPTDFTAFPIAFPTNQKEPALCEGIWGFGIFNSGESARIAAAKKLVHYLSTDPAQSAALIRATGHFPVSSAHAEVYAGTKAEKVNAPYWKMRRWLSDYYAVSPQWVEQRTAWWCMLQQVFVTHDIQKVADNYVSIVNHTKDAIVRRSSTHDGTTHSVLFLSSYSLTYPNITDELTGIEDALDHDAYLYSEFMDSSMLDDPDYISSFYRYLEDKYERITDLDAIIVDGDSALQMLIRHQDDLFSEMPVTYVNITSHELTLVAEALGMRGISQKSTLTDNLDLALKLNPSATRILAITDDTAPGAATAAILRGVRARYSEQEFEILDTSQLSRAQILQKVRDTDSSTILLLAYYSEDREHPAIGTEEGLRLITKNARTAVYTPFWMAQGSVGGIYADAAKIGDLAGKKVMRYARGADSDQIKTTTADDLVSSTFDATVLRDYHLSRSLLPDGAKVVNGSLSSRRMVVLLVVLIVLLLLAFTIIFHSEHRKNTQNLQQLQLVEAQLRSQALIDELTGIGNRRLFDEQLAHFLREHPQFSLFICDVDYFKDVNDQYGHLTGDAVLHEIGYRFSRLSFEHLLTFRYGGDEFAVLYAWKTQEELGVVSDRIAHLMDDPVIAGEHSLPITISAGMASFPMDADNGPDLFHCADEALYQVKRSRPGGVRTR